MSQAWNEKKFDEFIILRDELRLAKREKRYQDVIAFGIKIIEIDKNLKSLNICTPIFIKDMGTAFLRLGDIKSSLNCFVLARNEFIKYRESDSEWQKDIDVLERKIKKIQSKISC